MIDIEHGPVEVKLLSAGSNWLKVGGMLGLGLTGYFGALPKGSSVSVHTAHTGEMCMVGPEMVAAGTYHFGITTPTWLARTAAEGRGAFGFGERQLPLKAVAVFPHYDQLALAVRKDLGITSIRQLVDEKVPLRISTAPTHMAHPVGWVLDVLLAEYGIEIEDFERWGGEVIFGDRQPNFMETVPSGRRDRMTSIQSGAINAIFDEALMTVPWQRIAASVDLTFLPIDRDVLNTLERKYYVRQCFLPEGRLRGIGPNIPGIDFTGWILYCREDLPDRLVYLMLQGLDEQKSQIESLFQPGQGLTGTIDMTECCKNTELPLHAGAVQYYREKGYMK